MIAIVPYADTKADVVKDVVEGAELLNGSNMQLKRVYDDACMAVGGINDAPFFKHSAPSRRRHAN
jgi:hypothetical protein